MKTTLPIHEVMRLRQGGDLLSYRSLSCLSGAINWAGVTARLAIRASWSSEPALVTVTSVTTALGFIRLDPNGGILRRLTPAAVSILGPASYVHDVEVIFASGRTWGLFRGETVVTPTATR